MAKVNWKKREFSRKLRKSQTEAEQRLWRLLRSRQLAGHKFRRQRVIGPYIVDFCSLGAQLIVELDGGQHLENRAYDLQRDAFLLRKGFRVMRFWDGEILKNPEGVTQSILSALTPTLSHPADGRGRSGEVP